MYRGFFVIHCISFVISRFPFCYSIIISIVAEQGFLRSSWNCLDTLVASSCIYFFFFNWLSRMFSILNAGENGYAKHIKVDIVRWQCTVLTCARCVRFQLKYMFCCCCYCCRAWIAYFYYYYPFSSWLSDWLDPLPHTFPQTELMSVLWHCEFEHTHTHTNWKEKQITWLSSIFGWTFCASVFGKYWKFSFYRLVLFIETILFHSFVAFFLIDDERILIFMANSMPCTCFINLPRECYHSQTHDSRPSFCNISPNPIFSNEKCNTNFGCSALVNWKLKMFRVFEFNKIIVIDKSFSGFAAMRLYYIRW